jgi:hypothetical protein
MQDISLAYCVSVPEPTVQDSGSKYRNGAGKRQCMTCHILGAQRPRESTGWLLSFRCGNGMNLLVVEFLDVGIPWSE